MDRIIYSWREEVICIGALIFAIAISTGALISWGMVINETFPLIMTEWSFRTTLE